MRDGTLAHLQRVLAEVLHQRGRLVGAFSHVADHDVGSFLAGEVGVESAHLGSMFGLGAGADAGALRVLEDLLRTIRGLDRDGFAGLVDLGDNAGNCVDNILGKSGADECDRTKQKKRLWIAIWNRVMILSILDS